MSFVLLSKIELWNVQRIWPPDISTTIMSGTTIVTHTLKCVLYIGVPGNQKRQNTEKMASSCDSEMPNEFWHWKCQCQVWCDIAIQDKFQVHIWFWIRKSWASLKSSSVILFIFALFWKWIFFDCVRNYNSVFCSRSPLEMWLPQGSLELTCKWGNFISILLTSVFLKTLWINYFKSSISINNTNLILQATN